MRSRSRLVQGRCWTLGSGHTTTTKHYPGCMRGDRVFGHNKGDVWFHQSFSHTLVERHKMPVKPSVDRARASDDSARRCKSGVVGQLVQVFLSTKGAIHTS
jgi:hypothetical protein